MVAIRTFSLSKVVPLGSIGYTGPTAIALLIQAHYIKVVWFVKDKSCPTHMDNFGVIFEK